LPQDSDPRLPRSPEDEENLRILREEARSRLLAEESLQAEMDKLRSFPMTVYGGPPLGRPSGRLSDSQSEGQSDRPFAATVYGGPPGGGGPVTRRWTLRGILLLILGILGGAIAAIFGYRRLTAPVYGGPPAPGPGKFPAAVYGGPVPRPDPSLEQPKIQPDPKTKQHSKPHGEPPPQPPAPAPGPSVPSRPAPVYGGPPPKPQPPPNQP